MNRQVFSSIHGIPRLAEFIPSDDGARSGFREPSARRTLKGRNCALNNIINKWPLRPCCPLNTPFRPPKRIKEILVLGEGTLFADFKASTPLPFLW
jgi:hypothetical protein